MVTILLVDDDALNRDMLGRRLQRLGYVVLLSADGRDCLEKASCFSPDVILMDMGMPVMSGWEATKVLKADPLTRRIPIIGLTAYAMPADRAEVLAAGCDDYDSKPIDLQRLIHKVSHLLSRVA